MYGIPKDLPLQRFVGDNLSQISIGVDGIHFNFDKAGTISVFGYWELQDKEGSLIDKAYENSVRKYYRIHMILNGEVISSSLNAPSSFTLNFKSGHKLSIFDDSKQYESFSIEPGGIIV